MAQSNGTPSIQSRIHEALERHSGPHPFWLAREKAAAELNLSVPRIKQLIEDSPELQARWGLERTQPPDEIDAMERQVTTDEQRFADVMEREEGRLIAMFEGMGCTNPEAQRMYAGLKFDQRNFKFTLQILNSTVLTATQKLFTIFQRHALRLEMITQALMTMDVMDESRGNLVLEEKALGEMVVASYDQLQKTFGRSLDAAKLNALVQHRIASGKQKKIKPAFQEVGQGIEVEVNNDHNGRVLPSAA